MDEYEKSIREKVFASKILTDGEWVYLVGLFTMAREHDDLIKRNEELEADLLTLARASIKGAH